jgi:hypothetical protein
MIGRWGEEGLPALLAFKKTRGRDADGNIAAARKGEDDNEGKHLPVLCL